MKKISALIVLSFLALQVVFSQSAPIKEAKMHLDNENYTAAQKTLTDYIAKNPKDIGEAYYYLGESYYMEGDKVELAREQWNKGVALDSKSAYNRVGVGKLLLDDNKPAEAAKEFALAVRYSKESPAIYSLIGTSYLNTKNPKPDQAVIYLNKARDGDTKNSQYLVQLGDAYAAQNESGKAMTNYEFASEKDKNNPDVYVKMARIWGRTTSNVDQAVSRLEEAITKFPNYAPAYKDLVEIYVRQGKSSKVTPLLQKYVQLAGTDLPARKRYVKYLAFQAKDYDLTISEGNRVLQEDPSDYTMYRWLGWAYAEKKQYQEAYDALTKYFDGVNAKGGTASTTEYNYYATAASSIGKQDVAVATYKRILETDSTRTDVYDLIGKLYFDNKMYTEAAASYEEKIGKGLGKAADYVTLGRSYDKLKDYVKADSAFAKVNQLSPTYAYAYNMRAEIANKIDSTGTLFLAKPHYEKIIELSNTDEKLKTDKTQKIYLANAYAYMGAYTFNSTQNTTDALALIDKALGIDPENTLAKYYKEQLAKAATPNSKGNR